MELCSDPPSFATPFLQGLHEMMYQMALQIHFNILQMQLITHLMAFQMHPRTHMTAEQRTPHIFLFIYFKFIQTVWGFGVLGFWGFGIFVRDEVEPDLVLVPLIGFDSKGHRLGYGYGHYDRTLGTVVIE